MMESIEMDSPAMVSSKPQVGMLEQARQVIALCIARVRAADLTTEIAPAFLAIATFALLYAQPAYLLVRDWWVLPEAGHGLLLAPVAIWLAAKAGIVENPKSDVKLGLSILVLAILVRYASGLAAELFTMRASMLMAIMGLTVFQFGRRQVFHWWLPFVLITLAIPLPELLTQALALPLQFKASQMGAALLRSRDIPVLLTGNVIRIPGNDLFVTEACSGLRSLTALLSLAILLGGLVLNKPISRIALVLLAIPIAVFVNGVRVFLTGFLVYFVDPKLGQGFMHLTEGWLLFIVSLVFLGCVAWMAGAVENLVQRMKVTHA
jgi:exosortase